MRFLTKSEVAGVLCVSVRTVTEYMKLGRLPVASRLGRRLLWSEEAIYACLESAARAAQVTHASNRPASRGRPRKFVQVE